MQLFFKTEDFVNIDLASKEEKRIIERIRNGETVVINMQLHKIAKKFAEEKGVYVRVDRYSKFGNPFHMKTESQRSEVCDKYKEWVVTKPDKIQQIKKMKGKVFGCHCHPKQCHADFMKYIADND